MSLVSPLSTGEFENGSLLNLFIKITLDRMKHLAAYLLLGIGGNSSPSASDVKNVLGSVGIEADEERLSKLLDELADKDLKEVPPFYRDFTIYAKAHS